MLRHVLACCLSQLRSLAITAQSAVVLSEPTVYRATRGAPTLSTLTPQRSQLHTTPFPHARRTARSLPATRATRRAQAVPDAPAHPGVLPASVLKSIVARRTRGAENERSAARTPAGKGQQARKEQRVHGASVRGSERPPTAASPTLADAGAVALDRLDLTRPSTTAPSRQVAPPRSEAQPRLGPVMFDIMDDDDQQTPGPGADRGAGRNLARVSRQDHSSAVGRRPARTRLEQGRKGRQPVATPGPGGVHSAAAAFEDGPLLRGPPAGESHQQPAWGYIQAGSDRYLTVEPANAAVDAAVSRDVTMRVASCSSLDKIKPLLQGRMHKLDALALSLVLYRLVQLQKAGAKQRDEISSLALEAMSALERQVPTMIGRSTAATLYCMAKLKLRTPLLLGLLLYHLQRPQVLSSLKERDEAELLWSLATLNARLAPPALRRVSHSLASKSKELQSRSVSITVYALGRMQFYPGDDVLDPLVTVFRESGARWSEQEVANFVYGISALNFRPDEQTLDVAAAHLMEHFETHLPVAIESTLHTLAKFEYCFAPHTLSALTRRIGQHSDRFDGRMASLDKALTVLAQQQLAQHEPPY